MNQGETFSVKGRYFYYIFILIDPGSGEVVSNVLNCDRNQAEIAIKAAKDAFPAWSRMNPTVCLFLLLFLTL